GRSGKWFATEHFGVVPDIMTMAKGLSSGYAPIAATIVRPNVYEAFMEGSNTLSHLLTFGGQAVAAAAAIKNIEILGREDLPQRSAEMGAYLLQSLKQLADQHPTVGDARGLGLYCALELVKDKATKEKMERDSDFVKRLNQEIAKRRLLTRVWNIVHIAPPLVVTRAEVDRIVTILDESLTVAELEYGFA
ncbi:MAG: aspartate aminotransferase family protein, partial [Caldilineaceae bacterium]|nr:aspartate aminotransferase family protein [Caldilineaceae bacterium]